MSRAYTPRTTKAEAEIQKAQIIDLLRTKPMTRKQICSAIGLTRKVAISRMRVLMDENKITYIDNTRRDQILWTLGKHAPKEQEPRVVFVPDMVIPNLYATWGGYPT